MPRERDPECRGFLVADGENAILVSKADYPDQTASWWIPKSQIGYRCTTRATDPAHWDQIVFIIPTWLIEKKQCWELVP